MTRELIGGLALLIVPTIAVLILFRIRFRRQSQEKILYDLPAFNPAIGVAPLTPHVNPLVELTLSITVLIE